MCKAAATQFADASTDGRQARTSALHCVMLPFFNLRLSFQPGARLLRITAVDSPKPGGGVWGHTVISRGYAETDTSLEQGSCEQLSARKPGESVKPPSPLPLPQYIILPNLAVTKYEPAHLFILGALALSSAWPSQALYYRVLIF
jgi:hypothetical protein